MFGYLFVSLVSYVFAVAFFSFLAFLVFNFIFGALSCRSDGFFCVSRSTDFFGGSCSKAD